MFSSVCLAFSCPFKTEISGFGTVVLALCYSGYDNKNYFAFRNYSENRKVPYVHECMGASMDI